MRDARLPRPHPLIVAKSLGLSGWLAACSLPPLSTWHAPPPASPPPEVGTASWYGPGFHGNPTSSGEPYDPKALTAAHPTLPLGSRVRVRNLENGRSVEVRINDRGPFVEGRVIDLSYQAAREIGLLGPGTARVEIERLDDGSEAGTRVVWAVQAGSFSDRERALALKERLAERFGDVYVEPYAALGVTFHRVRLGPYPTRDEALSRARQLAGSGVGALVVEDVVR